MSTRSWWASTARRRSSRSRWRRAATPCSRGRRAPASRRCSASIAAASGRGVQFVEGNAELTPARLIGSHDPALVLDGGYTAEAWTDGPLVTAMRSGELLYLEELNRIPEETLNVLITAMAEREIVGPAPRPDRRGRRIRARRGDEPVRRDRHRARQSVDRGPHVPDRDRLPRRAAGARGRRTPDDGLGTRGGARGGGRARQPRPSRGARRVIGQGRDRHGPPGERSGDRPRRAADRPRHPARRRDRRDVRTRAGPRGPGPHRGGGDRPAARRGPRQRGPRSGVLTAGGADAAGADHVSGSNNARSAHRP